MAIGLSVYVTVRRNCRLCAFRLTIASPPSSREYGKAPCCLPPLPAADQAEAVASPITRYPFPASRIGSVPANIPSAFFGAL